MIGANVVQGTLGEHSIHNKKRDVVAPKRFGVIDFVLGAEEQHAGESTAGNHFVFGLFSKTRVVSACHGSIFELGGYIANGVQALLGEVGAEAPVLGLGGHQKTDQTALSRFSMRQAWLIIQLAHRRKHLAPRSLVDAARTAQNARNCTGRYTNFECYLMESSLCKHCKIFAKL